MQETVNPLNPLAELDQQWEQERISYVGVHNADRRIKIASLSVVGSLLLLFIVAGAAFLKEGINQGDVRFFLATLLLFGFSLVLGFGLHGIIRLRLAERRYLKKRAVLVRTLPQLSEPKPLHRPYRISAPLNPQSAHWTAAETQIYALQELHYAEPKRDPAYHAAIQKIIVDAPKAEQAYLTELVQLEQRWLAERLRSQMVRQNEQHKLTLKPWSILLIGVMLVGVGSVLAWNRATSALNVLALWSFGLVWIVIARELYQTNRNLSRAEQQYIDNQYALAAKYGRLEQESDLNHSH